MLDYAVLDAALRSDLSAARFSGPLENVAHHLTHSISGGQQGHATCATSAQDSDCCLSEVLTHPS